MNAKEARRVAFENAKDEINRIKATIEDFAKKGKTEVRVRIHPLLPGTLIWLKENGYIVSVDSFYTYTDISW